MTGCRVLFGSSLVWGSRGREFDSRHSDQRWLSRSAGASNPKGFGAFLFLRLQSRQRLLQAVGDGALAAYVQMAVDVRGHLDVRVSQPLLHVFQAVALRQQHAGAGVPLRYNYDKPEKPRRIKGFEVFILVFSSFSKPKNHTEISRIIGGVSLTRLPVS